MEDSINNPNTITKYTLKLIVDSYGNIYTYEFPETKVLNTKEMVEINKKKLFKVFDKNNKGIDEDVITNFLKIGNTAGENRDDPNKYKPPVENITEIDILNELYKFFDNYLTKSSLDLNIKNLKTQLINDLKTNNLSDLGGLVTLLVDGYIESTKYENIEDNSSFNSDNESNMSDTNENSVVSSDEEYEKDENKLDTDSQTSSSKKNIKIDDPIYFINYAINQIEIAEQNLKPQTTKSVSLETTTSPQENLTRKDAIESVLTLLKDQLKPANSKGGNRYIYKQAGKAYPKNVTFSKRNPQKKYNKKSLKKLQNILMSKH